MVFQSDTYSVLLVSASEKLNTAMASALPSTDFWPIRTVRSVSQARRLTLETPFDLILVNSPLPDGGALQFCIDVCSRSESGVLLLVPGDADPERVARAVEKLTATGRSVSVQERIPAAGSFGECIRLEEAETC